MFGSINSINDHPSRGHPHPSRSDSKKKSSVIQASRKIESIPSHHSSAYSATAKKVMAVIGIIFLLCGVFIPFMTLSSQVKLEKSSGVTPYLYGLTHTTSNQSAIAIEKFPKHVYEVIHPGIMTTSSGPSCQINDLTTISMTQCEYLAKVTALQVEMLMPDTYQTMMRTTEKGYGILFGVDTPAERKILFGMDARKVINQQNALRYLEKAALTDQSFFEKSKEELVEMIKETNRLILKNLSPSAGEFRKLPMTVYDDQTTFSFEDFEKTLKKNGGTTKEREHLISAWSKIYKIRARLDIIMKEFSPEEVAVFHKIAFFPCAPEEIAEAMDRFAAECKVIMMQIKSGEINPVAAAAYVHQQIGNIHPFTDANGRTARMWMNVMLQLGGYNAIVIPNDAAYTKAIIEDQKTAGAFVTYLEKTIEWNLVRNSASGVEILL